MYVGVWEHY